MNIPELIEKFASRKSLPVDVNDVLTCLKEHGNEDKIEFIGVDLDPDVLLGLIKIFHVRDVVYADPIRYVNIYYNRTQSVDWQRMICCKEIVHLLDPTSAETKTSEEIFKLAEKIGLPPEMQDPTSDGIATSTDRLAEFRAAAILLPWEARQVLLPAFKAGSLTTMDIARLADMPHKYVGFVMSDVWERVFPVLRGLT
jgi:hypothetical protein